MMNLSSAMRDQQYVQYQQKSYETMLADLKKIQQEAKKAPDAEMQKHIDALDKKDLKTTGWLTTPLDNVDHDFVSPLLNQYLEDLRDRMKNHSSEDGGFAKSLRKIIRLDESQEMVNVQFQKIASLKEMADEKEHQLERERIRAEHNKKVHAIITTRIDFKKDKGFKRQNSYLPNLDEFGDIDDADQLKRNF